MSEPLEAVAEALERAADAAAATDAKSIQRVLAAAVRLYAARAEVDPDLRALPTDPPWPQPTATETLVAVADLLDAAGLEIFELGLWRTMGGVRP